MPDLHDPIDCGALHCQRRCVASAQWNADNGADSVSLQMRRYSNQSGDSGVEAYAIHTDAIVVRFVNGGIYRYTRASAGARHLAMMKKLAENGSGLATYISQHRDDLDYERD